MKPRIEIYPSGSKRGNKKFRWRCRAANRQIVATGHQSFASKYNAERAAQNAARIMGRLLAKPNYGFVIVDLDKQP